MYTIEEIIEDLSSILNRKFDSIKERLKKFICKISKEDKRKIDEVARVIDHLFSVPLTFQTNPDWYIHSIDVRKGKIQKEIIDITKENPYHYRTNKQKMKEINNLKNNSIEDRMVSNLFGEIEAPKSIKSDQKRKRVKTEGKNYKTREEYDKTVQGSDQKMSEIQEPKYELNDIQKLRQPSKPINTKMKTFLDNMKSNEEDDIKYNAEILKNCLKYFSKKHKVSISDLILELQDKGGSGKLNMGILNNRYQELDKM